MKVLHPYNLPTRLPLAGTATAWLCLDRFGAPPWAWGVAGTVAVFWWTAVIYGIFKDDYVKLWPEDKKNG